jgi:hypothetical protein
MCELSRSKDEDVCKYQKRLSRGTSRLPSKELVTHRDARDQHKRSPIELKEYLS